MGRLIAVEGLDGAGKNTLVTGLVRRWRERGVAVATVSFPRYHQSLFADVAAEALHGEHGDLRESVYAMALLFALDRSAAAPEIRAALESNDVVVADRYVASNAAYSAARLAQSADGEVVRWVHDLEFGRLDLPRPDHTLFLAVSADVAMSRAQARSAGDPTRPRDHYERDADLQRRVDATYRELARSGWASPWTEVADAAPETLIDLLGAGVNDPNDAR
ncbi:dTMP kinase [Gordonia polyisoprenivorans]|uniref:dTMP kinase n=1 Tax=Gordonia polyisoprenivorans TaxID=84595 RepID=UPI0003A59936|nr:dTMP kinase [Gordonia polyisoprenivorans]